VVNGETVWAEEIVWLPKLAEDISYHHEHIKDAILKAAEHMPSFDAVGVSTAGVLVANRAMVSHLFLKVPKDRQGEACKNVYVDVLEELGVPYAVANDGDVAALAASMAMERLSLISSWPVNSARLGGRRLRSVSLSSNALFCGEMMRLSSIL
jgi:hypothetical protein